VTDSRKQLARTERISELENARLNALIADVVRIDARINEQQRQIAELQQLRDRTLTGDERYTVEMLTQNSVWTDGVDRSIEAIRTTIQSLQGERTKAQQLVMQQRSRVKGLETLLESLRFDVKSKAATEQMLIADEKALNDYVGR